MSSSANRAYADQLTGALHLLDMPANALMKHVLNTRLPSAFLSSFLHEATHFWCEASDLGATLASMEMRAHRNLLSDDLDEQALVRDVAVVDAIRTLIIPLNEGMALFQEFDSFPGESSVWSDPGLWAGTLFAPVEREDSWHSNELGAAERISIDILDAITRYRTSPVAVQKKTELMMQSLSERNHFYLVGYLAVKQLWFAAASATPAFFDHDLFLTFLRFWIFQDWQIIDRLLDEALSPSTVVTLVAERLQDRLNAIALTDLSAEVELFSDFLNSAEGDHEQMMTAMHLDEDDLRSGFAKLSKMTGEVIHKLGQKGDDVGHLFADVMTLKHRQQMMRLALEEVQLEVNSFGRLFVRRGPAMEDIYLAGPAPEGVKEGASRGWIAVYYLVKLRKLLTIVTSSERPMAWFPSDLGISEEDFHEIRIAITKVISIEGTRGQLRRVSHEVVESLGVEGSTHDLGNPLREYITTIYKRYAFSFVREESGPTAESLLNQKGLYSLLGKDGDVLTALAIISLQLGWANREDLQTLFSAYDIDPICTLQKIEDATLQSGAQILLTTVGGEIVCRV